MRLRRQLMTIIAALVEKILIQYSLDRHARQARNPQSGRTENTRGLSDETVVVIISHRSLSTRKQSFRNGEKETLFVRHLEQRLLSVSGSGVVFLLESRIPPFEVNYATLCLGRGGSFDWNEAGIRNIR
ncbi:hypothetical protein CEXT_235071 [Caerostris extrusa]|uniref:Uncharacterized protein n=1 Tax=Caerostris extrusa TaxID=172846 RepID=A0AAV4XSD9_CAEEX|nr:hypothetical protein CEXT_235071 [Caerostris extrusa]